MDNQLFRDIQTDLDLNGPILSFTTQPADVTINVGQNATFTAVATVSFPGDSSPANTGTIAYQWYGPGGILTEGTKYVGTKTTTLQITNVTSPTDVGDYYAVVDYVPSSETGNALNEPFKSDNGNLISPPLIEIIAQPTPVATLESEDRNFNIDAQLSNNGTDIGYQWQLDGSDVSNGTITKNGVDTVVAGATSPTLTLTSNNSGIGYVARCRVSSATASNSPIVSDSQIYTVNVPTNVIDIESIKNAGNQATLSSTDLANGEIIKNGRLNSRHAKKAMDWVNFTDDIEIAKGGKSPIENSMNGTREHIRRKSFSEKLWEEINCN